MPEPGDISWFSPAETIEESYQDYAAKVMNPDAGPVQKKETRRAFWAGVVTATSLLARAATLDDEVREAETITRLQAEIQAFVAEQLNEVANLSAKDQGRHN